MYITNNMIPMVMSSIYNKVYCTNCGAEALGFPGNECPEGCGGNCEYSPKSSLKKDLKDDAYYNDASTESPVNVSLYLSTSPVREIVPLNTKDIGELINCMSDVYVFKIHDFNDDFTVKSYSIPVTVDIDVMNEPISPDEIGSFLVNMIGDKVFEGVSLHATYDLKDQSHNTFNYEFRWEQ